MRRESSRAPVTSRRLAGHEAPGAWREARGLVRAPRPLLRPGPPRAAGRDTPQCTASVTFRIAVPRIRSDAIEADSTYVPFRLDDAVYVNVTEPPGSDGEVVIT